MPISLARVGKPRLSGPAMALPIEKLWPCDTQIKDLSREQAPT